MKRLLLATVCVGFLLVAGTGCRTTLPEDEQTVEELPWNSPAGWEGQTLGVPY